MISLLIAYPKFDLNLVFKVTTIIGIFTFGVFEGGTNCHRWVWKIFIMTEEISVEELPNIRQPDQLDLCQCHSSNRQFLNRNQWHAT